MRIRVTCSVVLVLVSAMPAAAYQRPGSIELISGPTSGGPPNDSSVGGISLSADGRSVAFVSAASNLVPGDKEWSDDVFVLDRSSAHLTLVSRSPAGLPANGQSWSPSISPNGRFVAFMSRASDLTSGDKNGHPDVFLHDLSEGTTLLVSRGLSGAPADGASFAPRVSADARRVVFQSEATNLVPGDSNGVSDIFVRDLLTGTTERVSVSSTGLQADGISRTPSISDTGDRVAFESSARNLVPDDRNAEPATTTGGVVTACQRPVASDCGRDVFVHDLVSGITRRVSVASDGNEAGDSSYGPIISGDGQAIAFTSDAADLVPRDGNEATDVFVHRLDAARTERVSVSSDGTEFVGAGLYRSAASLLGLSHDGRFVAFYSGGRGLAEPDENDWMDVFVHDRSMKTTERVSVSSEGSEGNDSSYLLALADRAVSDGGRMVGFHSSATNLHPSAARGRTDVFARDRGPETGIERLAVTSHGASIHVEGRATFGASVLGTGSDPLDPSIALAGADLTGLALFLHPESDRVVANIAVSRLPGPSGDTLCEQTVIAPGCVYVKGSGPAPGIVYGIRFEIGGARYEVRADATRFTQTWIGLYECDLTCEVRSILRGDIGATGDEVRFAIPLDILSGRRLDRVAAFAAIAPNHVAGSVAPPVMVLDELALGTATVPEPLVEVRTGPGGDFRRVDLMDGSFTSTIAAEGAAEVHARACLGTSCGGAALVVEGGGA